MFVSTNVPPKWTPLDRTFHCISLPCVKERISIFIVDLSGLIIIVVWFPVPSINASNRIEYILNSLQIDYLSFTLLFMLLRLLLQLLRYFNMGQCFVIMDGLRWVGDSTMLFVNYLHLHIFTHWGTLFRSSSYFVFVRYCLFLHYCCGCCGSPPPLLILRLLLFVGKNQPNLINQMFNFLFALSFFRVRVCLIIHSGKAGHLANAKR